MNREPVPTTENPTGGNGVPAGYGPAAPNPAPGVAQNPVQAPAQGVAQGATQVPAPSPAPAAAPSPAPAPAAGFQSGDIAHTQAAQDKEYFRQDEPTGRWARLCKWLKEHRKAALAILLGGLVLLGLLVWGVVWLVSSVTTDGETVSVELIGEITNEDSSNADGAIWNVAGLIEEPTTSDDELIAAINEELNTLTTETSRFIFLLGIADMLANTDRAELSFEYLNSIDTATLNDDQLFTYYAYWATIYGQLGNEEQSNYYLELMDELGVGSSTGAGGM